MKDWKKVSPMMEMMSRDDLIKMRVSKPNILMRPKQWDTKMEDIFQDGRQDDKDDAAPFVNAYLKSHRINLNIRQVH